MMIAIIETAFIACLCHLSFHDNVNDQATLDCERQCGVPQRPPDCLSHSNACRKFFCCQQELQTGFREAGCSVGLMKPDEKMSRGKSGREEEGADKANRKRNTREMQRGGMGPSRWRGRGEGKNAEGLGGRAVDVQMFGKGYGPSSWRGRWGH